MIDEKYLINAITIRRTYLKLINNVELYQKRALQVSEKLEDTLIKLDKFKEELVNEKNPKNLSEKDAFNKLLGIIDEVADEGKRLEELIKPINTEIEKLAKEEAELYRQIVEHNKDLTEDEIVNIVRDRLIKEGLS